MSSAAPTHQPPHTKSMEQELRSLIRAQGSVLVALSGGVDSSLIATVAAQELHQQAVAATGVSASLDNDDLLAIRRYCEDIGLAHTTITTDELDVAAYVENSPDRCYFCKNELFGQLGKVAADRGLHRVVDGTTKEDLKSHRPGYLAALEHEVLSPLVDIGATKKDVRDMAKRLGLPNAGLPASPCLSSRIAYGTRVTAERLHRVGEAESFIRSLGFLDIRVRLHKTIARIEVPLAEMPLFIEHRAAIDKRLHELGFTYVTLDLGGLRSGSMLEALDAP